VGTAIPHCSHNGCVHHRKLEDNNLKGKLPGSLADLSHLTTLYVYGHRRGCVLPPLTHPLGRYLHDNKLAGVVPNLPFTQYTFCSLQNTPPTNTNHFACPLPQVRQHRRVHVTAASTTTPCCPDMPSIHPSVCPL
jgi:hypothetical protein